MAHITSIDIDGLLGRKERVSFDLKRDVNIFFGENGCGKTTLLKIIDAALNRDGSALESMPVTRAEISIFSATDQRVIKHTWERNPKSKNLQHDYEYLRQTGRLEEVRVLLDRNPLNSWKLSPRFPSSRQHTRWAHTFLPTTRLYLSEKAAARAQQASSSLSEAQLDDAFADSINRSWLVFYSNVLQEVRRVQEEGLRAVLHNVFAVGPSLPPGAGWDAAAVHRRVVNFMSRQPQHEKLEIGSVEQFRKRYVKDENLRRAVDVINDVEQKIESAMVPIDKFRETVELLFSNGKKLGSDRSQLQVSLADGTIVPPTSLSSGEKHLIKILLAAMSSDANTVIIDEPELSMHIDWQRVFVPTILSLNPNCQLILASHSPEVMAEVADDRIFKL